MGLSLRRRFCMRSKLLIGAALLWGRVARRDDPYDFFMAYYMHDKQQSLGLRSSDRSVSGFIWFGRIDQAHEWIEENLASKLERHAVPQKICVSLGSIPFKCDTTKQEEDGPIHSVLTTAIRCKAPASPVD